MDDEPKAPFDPQSDDPTPAGDTPEHGDDASRGGSGGPADDNRVPGKDPKGPPAGRYKSGVVGGEAESDPAADVGEPPKP